MTCVITGWHRGGEWQWQWYGGTDCSVGEVRAELPCYLCCCPAWHCTACCHQPWLPGTPQHSSVVSGHSQWTLCTAAVLITTAELQRWGNVTRDHDDDILVTPVTVTTMQSHQWQPSSPLTWPDLWTVPDIYLSDGWYSSIAAQLVQPLYQGKITILHSFDPKIDAWVRLFCSRLRIRWCLLQAPRLRAKTRWWLLQEIEFSIISSSFVRKQEMIGNSSK